VSTLTTKGGDYALQGNSKREGTAPHQLPREMVVISGREGMVLEMSEEDGELCPLYVEAAPVKLVVNRGKRV